MQQTCSGFFRFAEWKLETFRHLNHSNHSSRMYVDIEDKRNDEKNVNSFVFITHLSQPTAMIILFELTSSKWIEGGLKNWRRRKLYLKQRLTNYLNFHVRGMKLHSIAKFKDVCRNAAIWKDLSKSTIDHVGLCILNKNWDIYLHTFTWQWQ